MARRTGKDLDEALDIFIGDAAPRQPRRPMTIIEPPKGDSATAAAEEAEKREVVKLRKKPQQPKKEGTMTTSWIGRMPGRKNGEVGPKSKTTIRIDTELINEYRDRVFVERRPLGQLIEDAMRQNKERNW